MMCLLQVPANLDCFAVGLESVAREETDAPGEQRDDSWNPAELMDSQLKDPNLRPVIELMETPETFPEEEEVLRFSEATKELWAQKDVLTLVNGVLYRRLVTGSAIFKGCS